MAQHRKEIIRILGIIFIVYGGVKIFVGLEGSWLTLSMLFYPSEYNTMLEHIFYSTMTILLTIILPSGAIIGGIGLLKQKKWGWVISVVVALSTFIMSSLGTINFIVASYRYKNMPIPPIPEGAVVGIVSMIPTYIQCIVSLIIAILLSRKFVKQSFG